MSKQREYKTFSRSMHLYQVKRALEGMTSPGWRLPDADELSEILENEEVDLPNIPQSLMGHVVNMPLRWYWSSTIASESPHEYIRERMRPHDDARVVVKYDGEQDTQALDIYGTILVRDKD